MHDIKRLKHMEHHAFNVLSIDCLFGVKAYIDETTNKVRFKITKVFEKSSGEVIITIIKKIVLV